LLLLAVALLGYLPYSSYCEQVFGTSTNAAQNGYTWVMTNVLPQQAGLTVNGIVYRYTTIKDPNDPMVVYVQNENPIDGGYTFRSVDDWTGLPGNSINKAYPIANIPIEYWGDGSIEWMGDGEVSEPTVIYTYGYDTCFDPQSDPSCPGYKPSIPDIPTVAVVDPLGDQFIQDEIDREMTMRDEDEEERNRKQTAQDEEQAEEEVDLEAILGVVDRSLQGALDTVKHGQLRTMSNFSQMYYTEIPDTVYKETITLQDSKLPRNVRGRRLEFAQQKLHQQLVKSQYKK
jgi:hypothetical protein